MSSVDAATAPQSGMQPSNLGSGARPLYPPRIVPPAEPLPRVAFFRSFVRNPLLTIPQAVYEEPMLATRRGRRGVVWITDPTLIKTVLLDRRDIFVKTPLEKLILGPLLGNGILTSEGPEWRWQRQIAAPLFRHQDLIAFVPPMVAAAASKVDRWRTAEPGTVWPIDDDMTKVTFDVISATLLPGGETHVQPNIEKANVDFLGPVSWRGAYGIFGLPKWLPHPGKARMAHAERVLRGSVAALLAERRADPVPHDDLMQRLMQARHPETGEPMSDEQLIDNLLTFFSAGHETTAKALSWTLYLIARAPEWQEAIREEVARVCGSGPIEGRHIDTLQITQQVLKESMRLYPPAPVISRISTEATELGGTPIGAGVQAVIPIYAAHRHRKRWQDPDRFDPTRFTPEREKAISRYQYLPFGAGPRICIGMAFAMIEATAILGTLVRHARFEALPGHEPEPVSRVTLRPKGGMPLKVRMVA